jgi:hypothetical protein
MMKEQEGIKQDTAPIKPYSIKELSELYGMGSRTIQRWLLPFKDELGERNGRYYTVKQVGKIFELLGEPGKG